MSDTHVNAFKQDVKDALAEAHKAVSEAEAKFQALLEKLEADLAPVVPATEVPAPADEPDNKKK